MGTKKDMLKPELWTPRSVDDTMKVYADWADTYHEELTAGGYRTPGRIAEALKPFCSPDTTILDYGCGTGIGGLALKSEGYKTIHGTDISAEMLEQADKLGIYSKTWLSEPGGVRFERGSYPVIFAAGVVSLGAAPADMLGVLVSQLNLGDLLAFSFNDPTLNDTTYTDALEAEIGTGRAEVVFREHGPHLDDVNMNSDVIILQRR